jgi:hypothetical protein
MNRSSSARQSSAITSTFTMWAMAAFPSQPCDGRSLLQSKVARTFNRMAGPDGCGGLDRYSGHQKQQDTHQRRVMAVASRTMLHDRTKMANSVLARLRAGFCAEI